MELKLVPLGFVRQRASTGYVNWSSAELFELIFIHYQPSTVPLGVAVTPVWYNNKGTWPLSWVPGAPETLRIS